MLAVWQRLPTIARALLSGVAVALGGLLPWAAFSLFNQRYGVAVPWAIVPTALWLWLYWRWIGGHGWPSTTSATRRQLRRANAVDPDLFGMAMLAGMVGFAALAPFTILLNRLVTLNQAKPIVLPPDMPAITAFMLLIMASVVAGVTEEAGFRGYLQSPIEKRHGIVAAILVSGLLFGLAHFRHHPGVATLGMLPYYMYAAALYGLIAYATNSIIPGLVLHAVGDVFVLSRWWLTGRGEWQLTESTPATIWQTGPDGAFWTALAAFIVLGGAATATFAALIAAGREKRAIIEVA